MLEDGEFYMIVFIFYIGFCLVGLMNVVTGLAKNAFVRIEIISDGRRDGCGRMGRTERMLTGHELLARLWTYATDLDGWDGRGWTCWAWTHWTDGMDLDGWDRRGWTGRAWDETLCTDGTDWTDGTGRDRTGRTWTDGDRTVAGR